MIGAFNYRAPVPAAAPTTTPSGPTVFALRPPQVCRKAVAKPRYITGLEPADMEATFAGGVRVQLRYEQNTRWLMWISRGGVWTRRKDFASPYAEHACRCAEQWFGQPISGWRVVEQGEE
jgi:hypothetical protein